MLAACVGARGVARLYAAPRLMQAATSAHQLMHIPLPELRVLSRFSTATERGRSVGITERCAEVGVSPCRFT